MRRWSITAFMLFVLSFQWVWAAAAPVCGHETQTAAKQHFGHHEHRHHGSASGPGAAEAIGTDASTGASAADGSDSSDGLGAYHPDCETCHLGSSVALTSSTPVMARLPDGAVPGEHRCSYRSHIPCGLERPDRLELTAAARFGGGVEFSPQTA